MNVLFFFLQEMRGLPAWTRWIFTIMLFASVLGVSEYVSPVAGLIVALGLAAVVGVVALVQYMIAKRRDKKASEFGGELQGNSESTPDAVNDPGRRARLADLRKNFEQGLERYRSTGKDLYKRAVVRHRR
ncbi:hypothetical protein CfE428DRAFT_2855 [Chthoniobacter flavus Ellin428]|uniref:Uncharacterized protein n=1 Tax=Chthoniobacter flavus Ellin428 TaxID=497964 RepID=B4D1R7_9BACT|nr:hypothetical protein [Chthoniobacter flavus]EDY19679.1 hypothetical protein CfE428DRAFT_2855 [Chthoniobacter flavus Ellin428]